MSIYGILSKSVDTYSLGRSFRVVASHLVEIVDDDTDEEIHDEVRADEHEQHEEPDYHHAVVPDWLHVHVGRIYGGVHDRRPGFRRGNLEEREQGLSDVVELLRNRLVPIQAEALAHLQRGGVVVVMLEFGRVDILFPFVGRRSTFTCCGLCWNWFKG